MGDQDEEPTVPPSIAAAWGMRQRPGKGPRPTLSVDRVVQAGIDVAVRDGLAAVSMKRVAGELGTAPMSLYRYVASKDELLVLMQDTAFGPPPADLPAPDDDWRAGLSRWAWLMRERLQQQSWGLAIPISGPPVTPNQVRWMDRGLRCTADTTLTEDEKLGVILLVSGFVRSDVLLTAQISEAVSRSGTADVLAGYSQLLRQVTDPERFPGITRVLEAGVFDSEEGPDEDFRFGLGRILDGVAALIDSRG